MTAAAVAAPRTTGARRSAPSPARAVRPRPVPAAPRLLLPPVAEPPRTVPEAHVAALADTRSVLSALTGAGWPLGEPELHEEAPLEDPTRLCGAVVVAAVEALTSSRPLVQLARWVSPDVFESLSRAARPAPTTGRRAVTLRRVRVCRVSPTVAEGTAVVQDGPRVRAAAVRFEVHRGSWRVTVLQIG